MEFSSHLIPYNKLFNHFNSRVSSCFVNVKLSYCVKTLTNYNCKRIQVHVVLRLYNTEQTNYQLVWDWWNQYQTMFYCLYCSCCQLVINNIIQLCNTQYIGSKYCSVLLSSTLNKLINDNFLPHSRLRTPNLLLWQNSVHNMLEQCCADHIMSTISNKMDKPEFYDFFTQWCWL